MNKVLTNLTIGGGRIAYADLAKCVAIFLVLWGHAITQLMNHVLTDNRPYMFIYAFHMPLFMLVSGLFARSSMKLTFMEMVIKKFRQLIVPALSFGILWYIHDVLVGNRLLGVKAFLFLEAECFWFLKCLFFAYIYAWITYRFKRVQWLVAIAFCLFFMALQYVGQSFFKMGIMLPCFYVGMVLKNYLPWIVRHKAVIGGICVVLFFSLFPFFTAENLFANKFFQTISLLSLGNWALCLSMGLLGSLMVLCGCMCVEKYFESTCLMHLFTKIGSYTLGIYLIQKILLELLLPHILKVDMNLYWYDGVFTPVVAIVFLFVCYYCTLLLKKSRFTRMLFLGEKK